jgi:chromosome segregation ATPase
MKYDSSIEVLRTAAEKLQTQIGFEKASIVRLNQDLENTTRALNYLEQEYDKLQVAITHLQVEDQDASDREAS